MKIAKIIIVLLPSVALANDEPHVRLEKVEKSRAEIHQAHSARIAQLNYIGMKLQSFKMSIARIERNSEELEGVCGEVTFSNLCVSKIESIQTDAQTQISRLEALLSSEDFGKISRGEANRSIHLEQVGREQVGLLKSLDGRLAALRAKAGKRLVDWQFRRSQERVTDKQKEFKRQVRCKLGPIELSHALDVAKLDLTQAQLKRDPYLLDKVVSKAGRELDKAEALADACRDAKLEAIKSRAREIISLRSSLPEFISSACARARNEEILAACGRGVATSDFLFSLHTHLADQ